MAVSVAQSVKENEITFKDESLVDNNSGWTITDGSGTVADNIVLSAASVCSIELNDLDLKATYLKLQAHITCNNTQLQTETTHAVTVCYNIKYVDNENNEQTIVECFYPKYDFETTYKNDFSIINVPSSMIKSISINIYNNEEEEIIITKSGLYYSALVDEKDIIDEYTTGCFMRVLYSPEELDTVQEGELCICAWV